MEVEDEIRNSGFGKTDQRFFYGLFHGIVLRVRFFRLDIEREEGKVTKSIKEAAKRGICFALTRGLSVPKAHRPPAR